VKAQFTLYTSFQCQYLTYKMIVTFFVYECMYVLKPIFSRLHLIAPSDLSSASDSLYWMIMALNQILIIIIIHTFLYRHNVRCGYYLFTYIQDGTKIRGGAKKLHWPQWVVMYLMMNLLQIFCRVKEFKKLAFGNVTGKSLMTPFWLIVANVRVFMPPCTLCVFATCMQVETAWSGSGRQQSPSTEVSEPSFSTALPSAHILIIVYRKLFTPHFVSTLILVFTALWHPLQSAGSRACIVKRSHNQFKTSSSLEKQAKTSSLKI